MSDMARWRRLRKAGPFGLGLMVVAILAACGDDDDDEAGSVSQPQTVSVLAGSNDPQDPTVAVTEYLPESVTVTAGSTVEWKLAVPEPHSVTFFPTGQAPPPPGSDESLSAPRPPTGPFDGKTLVNSGLPAIGAGPTAPFTLTFPAAGSYRYVCIVHPLMTGTVTVVDAGGEAETQAQITARADAELARWLEEGRAAKEALGRTSPRSERAPDGTTSWQIEMGVTTEHTDVLAFVPSAAEVRPGDRVVFVNNSGSPHTASFAGRQQLPQDPTSPQVAAPAPGPAPQTLNATDLFNTGLLPPNVPPGSGPPEPVRSFAFVVPAAGTYTYVCLLHAPSGMAGSIKVA